MKKYLLYTLYLLVVTLTCLELGVRFLTEKRDDCVEFFMGKKAFYMLPLPTAEDCYVAGKIGTENQEDSYRVFDDTLGWSHAAWGLDTSDFPCYANEKGFRIDKNAFYKREKALKQYDIITIGNSFTHCDAVAVENSWPYMLAQNTGKSVANLGVGGYGLQQALLRLMYSGIHADTVLFGAVWTDFDRALEPVHSFYQGGNKTRPMLKFADHMDEGYTLVNLPVARPEEFYQSKAKHNAEIFSSIPGLDESVFSNALWTNSYFLRAAISFTHQKKHYKQKAVYLVPDQNLAYCMRIFDVFKSYCEREGMYPIVVLLDVDQNFADKENFNLQNPWTLVKENLDNQKIKNVEFHQEIFELYAADRHNIIHPTENLHYSEQGNRIVSELIQAKLFAK